MISKVINVVLPTVKTVIRITWSLCYCIIVIMNSESLRISVMIL